MDFNSILYLLLLFLCTICSFTNKTAREEKLWIYFTTTLIVESYVIFIQKNCDNSTYLYSSLICNIFLVFYFIKNKKLSIPIATLYTACLVWAMLKQKSFNEVDTISVITLFIFLSLYYYISQIRTPNEIPLHKKQHFWMATGILIWTLAYFFSVFPIYYFAKTDFHFLITITEIFQYVNTFCYFIFLIGTNSKHS